MAAFSTNTNILSPPPSHHHRRRLPLRSSSNLLKTHSTLNYFNTAKAALHPTTTTTTTDPDVRDFASTTATGWAEFAEKVSGEWDGFGAEFTAEGKPIELPESVVPEAYREWEVKVFDWQTQCPTLAQSHNNNKNNNDLSLMYKTIRLLPTVGCEADAATRYSIEERNLTDSSAFAYESTGCYVALWPSNKIELEHCLIDPSNKESRVRIIQVLEEELQDDESAAGLKLKSISVFAEQWYGPFRNGDQLGGCAIRDSAFAATQPLQASQVSGVWQALRAGATFHASQTIQQVGDECILKTISRNDDDDGIILLPKQLWCSVKRTKDKDTCCEVGWLLDQGRAITSNCTFSSTGELKEIAIARETATLTSLV